MSDIIVLPNPPDYPDSSPFSTRELEINRRNTRAFIESDPIFLALQPRVKVNTPDGGFKMEDGEERDTQTFRLLPQSDIMPSVQTPDGITLTPTYVLLGEWDALMDRWDRFFVNDVAYQIVSPIRPDYTMANVYERKGDVARL